MMKTTHKLLAVVMWLGSTTASADAPRTLANGAPACGNTMSKSSKPKPNQACRAAKLLYQATVDLETAKEALVEAKGSEVAAISAYVTTPRRLANGAPACGNVMGKGDREECTAELADQEDAARLLTMKTAIVQTTKMRSRVHEVAQRVASARLAVEPEGERRTEVARR